MYCNNCGKNNPEQSKFCQHCGIKLNDKQSEAEENIHTGRDSRPNHNVDSETPPYPYVISIWKLTILSVATFGLYEIYWFYKHWKSLKTEKGLQVTPWARALFAAIMSYFLFKEVSKSVRGIDKSRGLEAGALAIVYLILVSLWKLPEPYWWLSMLSFLPLIPVQNAINYYWEKKLNDKLIRSGFGVWNYIWTIIGVIIIILALYGTSSPSSIYNSSSNIINSTSSTNAGTSINSSSQELEKTYGQNFMKSCNSDGNLYQSCSCLLNYLRANYTLTQRIKMDSDYLQTKQIPQAMTNAISACTTSNQ